MQPHPARIRPVTSTLILMMSGPLSEASAILRCVTTYEDSDLPEIAVAPPGYDPTSCTHWVRTHEELMMLRDLDGHWILFFFAANGSVQCESPAFWGITDRRVASRVMRKWLDDQGLLDLNASADNLASHQSRLVACQCRRVL